jgi:hypothetical protein
MSWDQMRTSRELTGRWVALDNIRFAPGSSEPLEADLVDVDDDLVELCARIREGDRTSCRILHCVSTATSAPAPCLH